MEALHDFISALIILSLVQQSLGLMSDYKTCGDQACARMISRVQALRDHQAPDCRFLSFKKGNMIDVYHKLAGKRTDLWAGSIDKQFGYFPKAAVRIDEVFVDEKTEIQMAAQTSDFFCIDAFGSIIDSNQVFEDHKFEDQTAKSEDLGNSDFDDPVSKSAETNDLNEKSSVPKDGGESEPGRSSWIRSAVTGWFGNSEVGNKDQENFRSRKLALDIEENQLEEEEPELKDNAKNINENNDMSNTQSKSWLGVGIRNILGFEGGESKDIKGTEPTEEQSQTQDEKQNAEGWYGSIYNRITSLYEDPPDNPDDIKDVKSDPKDEHDDTEFVNKTLLLINEGEVQNNDGHSVGTVKENDNTRNKEEGEWYGDVFNRDKNDSPVKEEEIKDAQQTISEGSNQGTGPNHEINSDLNRDLQEQEGQSSEKIPAGWYGRIYDRITNIYDDSKPDREAGHEENEAEEANQFQRLENDGHFTEEIRTVDRFTNLYGETTDKTESQTLTQTPQNMSTISDLKPPFNSDIEESDQQKSLSESETSEPSSVQTHLSSSWTNDEETLEDSGSMEKDGSYKDVSDDQFVSDEVGDKAESDREKTADSGLEYAGDMKDVDLTQTDSDGESNVVSVTQTHGKEHVGLTQVEPTDEREGKDNPQMDIDAEKSTQMGKEVEEGANDTHIPSTGQQGGEDAPRMDSDESKEGDNFTQITSGVTQVDSQEPEDVNLSQDVNVKEGVDVTQMESQDTTQTELFETKEGLYFAQAESQEQGVDSTPVESQEFKEKVGNDSPPVDFDGEKGVEVVQLESDGEKEGVNPSQVDSQEKEDADKEKNKNVTLRHESDGEKEAVDVTQMEAIGEKGDLNMTEVEPKGKVGFTEIKHDGEKEGQDVPKIDSDEEMKDVDNMHMNSDEENKDVELIQTEFEEKDDADVPQIDSDEEKGITQIESQEKKDVDVTEMNSDVEKKDVEFIQIEFGEKDGTDVPQMDSDGEKEDVDLTQMESQEKEGVDVPQIDSDGEKEDVDVNQMNSDEEMMDEERIQTEFGEKDVVDVPQTESQEKEGADLTQTESKEQDDVDVPPVDSDGEKVGEDIAQMDSYDSEEGGNVTQMETHGETDGEIISEAKQKPNDDSEQPENVTNASEQTEPSFPISNGEHVHDASSVEANGAESDINQELGVELNQMATDVVEPSNTEEEREKTEDLKNNDIVEEESGEKQDSTSTTMDIQHTYLMLEAHLGVESVQDLLTYISRETLSWLDDKLGNSEYINNDDFDKLIRLEQTLENLMKSRNKEDGNRKPSVQNIYALLTMLRKEFMPFVVDGSVNKIPDPIQKQCVSGKCTQSTKETPKPEDNGAENSSDKSDFHEDGTISKTFQDGGPRSDRSIITETFTEPEKSQIGDVLQQYGVLVVEFTSDAVAYIVDCGADVRDVIQQAVMSLPDDIRPGPDLYGMPWEAVIVSAALGFLTVLLFTCRFVQSIKSRLYASRERRMGQKVAELLEEKSKVLETLSECKRKFDKLEDAMQHGALTAQASEMRDLEVMSKELEQSNVQMKSDIERLQEQLEQQNQLRKQQNEQLEQLEETLKNLKTESKDRKSQLEQEKTTLKIYEMNTERLQKKLQEAKEENVMLLESKTQLEKESEGWLERLSELEEERRMSERAHDGMIENCANKDERIKSLTECLLKMKDWDSEEESGLDDASGSENTDVQQKQKVQKLIHAAKMSADLKAIEEDKSRMFAKLADEIKAKEDLQEGIEQMQNEKGSVESESATYSAEIQKLQHKLQIMTEMYQENELKLHRMLTVEEKERSQKEQQLNKAGEKISLAAEELNSYRQRAKDLEEELEKTNQAYKNQIASHEKKAHDNWLAARAADRDLTEVKRENSVLRQRLTDWQFKLELMEKEPYPRDAPVRLIRGERSPYGPSPLGRPPSETRPFLSPPTLMDGPPRVSPQFPMMPGGRAPPSGVVEGDRSVPHSEDGSPTWERERDRERRGFGPQGPDSGMIYRRPPSAPFLRGPPPPDAYYGEKPDASFGGNGTGGSENDSRNSVHSLPPDGRPPPDVDMRMPPLPGPFPPLDPRDPLFPRRSFRPDFPPFPTPPMGLRGPLPPPGMFPRFPLPPHMAFPPMRPPADVSPEPPSRPSPPGSEQPADHRPTHDTV